MKNPVPPTPPDAACERSSEELGAPDGLSRDGLTRRRLLAAAGASLLAGGLEACTGSKAHRPAPSPPTSAGPTTTAAGRGRTLRIGYIAEITGLNSARGELVRAALDAFSGYVKDKLGGLYFGVTPTFTPADAPHTADESLRAYQDLVSQKMDAILWCTPFGLSENAAAVKSGGVPVIAVLADLYSYAGNAAPLLGSSASGSVLFQTMLPDAFAIDVMLSYGAEDRGFASAGLLYDTANYPGVASLFTAAAAKRGIVSAGTFSYDSTSGSADLSAPLQSLKKVGCQLVMCYGLADHVSSIAARLQSLDARYVDTPTAKRSFKPMVMGPRWGTGDVDFVRLAGNAAARGTISAGALGSIVSLPNLPMRKWLHDYRPDYNGGFPRGGEDAVADAAAALLVAAGRADSTRGDALVAALEAGDIVSEAGATAISFGAQRHLAPTHDDTALLSLELPPVPYNLGTEWKEVLPAGYLGPVHLVDYTLAANARVQPLLMQQILQRHYGTSATDDYQGNDPVKVAACKAVH